MHTGNSLTTLCEQTSSMETSTTTSFIDENAMTETTNDDRHKCRRSRRRHNDDKRDETMMEVIDLESQKDDIISVAPAGKENANPRAASRASRASSGSSPARSRPGSMRPRTAPRAPSRGSISSGKKVRSSLLLDRHHLSLHRYSR